MENCTYTLVPIEELDNVNYREVLQTSKDTVRKNDKNGNDATHFIVKWCGVMPTSIYQIAPIGDEDTKTCYTATELKAVIKDDLDWTNPPA